jgi:hypothetical protein
MIVFDKTTPLKLHLHHIAVLTHSLSAVEASLPSELERLGVDTFPNEGTKEQYIDLSASLSFDIAPQVHIDNHQYSCYINSIELKKQESP